MVRISIHLMIVLLATSHLAAQPTAKSGGTIPDLVSIRIEADSLKSEQMAVGKRLVELYPDSFNVLRIMGFVHSTHGNQDQMAECWRRCREISPNRPDIYDQLGRHSMEIEEYDEAIEYWKKSLELDAKFPGVYRRMGTALIASGKADEAVAALSKQIEIAPNDVEAHYQLGEALFQTQQYDAAKQSYLETTKRNPNYPKAYYGLVKTSARLGDTEGASKYSKIFQKFEQAAVKADQEFRRGYDDLQEIRADVAVTLVDAGRIFASDKKLDEALHHWLRAAAIDKKNQMSRSFAAKIYLSQKKPADALRYMEQLTKIEPENPIYHQQAGILMTSTKQFAGAEKHFRKVVELQPRNASAYRTLAKFYLNTKRNAELAYELAKKSVKLDPVADSYFVLGWSSAQLRKKDEADAALRKAISLDPENGTYKKLYESIFRTSGK